VSLAVWGGLDGGNCRKAFLRDECSGTAFVFSEEEEIDF
jgi:hypothetical protein